MTLIRQVSRRKMRQLRRSANRMYRAVRRPSVWDRLSLNSKVRCQAALEYAGSHHVLIRGPWGSNWIRRIRYVERKR